MTVTERRQEILALINKEGNMRAADLAEHFHVTSETIRKDLIYLNNKRLLKKGHGSAHTISETVEFSVEQRLLENSSVKIAIAQKALEYLSECSVIFIDAGSTLMELAKRMPALPQLVIITNSFSVVQALQHTGNTIYFVGGEVNAITQSTSGLWANNELSSLRIDIAFLGTSGFQSHTGPCTKIFSDAPFKKDVVKNSNKIIVLADHTKFSSNASMQFAEWTDVDLLISDNNVTPELASILQDEVELILATPDDSSI
ncbi:DeoR/GlpR family DNA-binding transcription regulator [Faecalicatena orotica]|nr:DeoR/GlpR family DNA-binding transcription regulator [Faecalicatena orotica]